MSLFVLRAKTTETYDCPDNGWVNICERYEDVAFSTSPKRLLEMAEDLNIGMSSERWYNSERLHHLRALHADFDDAYHYSVVDVTNLVTQ
jgi:hypothetical protein